MRGLIWKPERNRCDQVYPVPLQGLSPWLPVALSRDNSVTSNGRVVQVRTNCEMLFTITCKTRGIEAMSRLHRHKEPLLPGTSRVECEKARRLATLNACAFPYVTH